MTASNLTDANAFLEALDPNGIFTFQTFAEKRENRSTNFAKPRMLHGSFEQHVEELLSLNSSTTPSGIFVTVNETDGNGRKASNVVRVRAICVDLDGSPVEPVISGPLEPSIVVETSPKKYHAYWLTREVRLDEFTGLQKTLVEMFAGDPAVVDLPRVMRLPGFTHHKGDAFVSRLLTCNGGVIYSRSELLTAFGKRVSSEAVVGEGPLNTTASNIIEGGAASILAKEAIERVINDPTCGRHRHALALGLRCRESGLGRDAADQAARDFFENIPAADSDGRHRPLKFSEIQSAVRNGYKERITVDEDKCRLSSFVLTGPEISDLEITPRRTIVKPFITDSSLTMVYAKRGIGKTWFALELAKATATGSKFFAWDVLGEQRVLYVDGEMPLSDLKNRTAGLFGSVPPNNFMLLPSETLFLKDRPLRINDQLQQKRFTEALRDIEASGQKPDIVIFDNFSSLTSGMDENSNSDLDDFLAWLIKLRHMGYAIVLIHHAGKNGQQRGASRREDLLDTSIKLETVSTESGHSSDGASFTISFEKVRGKRPDPDVLTVSLIVDDHGNLAWAIGADRSLSPQEKVLAEILRLQPSHQNALAAALNLTEGRISQIVSDLREEKLLGKHLAITGMGRERLRKLGLDRPQA